MKRTIVFLLVAACASNPDANNPDAHGLEEPDAGSSTAVAETPADDATCSAPEVDDCIDDDDIAVCTRAAIKYEYEMLEARQQGDHDAFECHRGTLASLLDHACGLGDDQACGAVTRARKAVPPT